MIHYVLGGQLLLRVGLLVIVLLLLFRFESVKDGYVVTIILLQPSHRILVHGQLSI